MIEIKKDIDIATEASNHDVLLVGTNIYSQLCNGWQFDAKLLYPSIHKANLETKYGDVEKLGKTLCVQQENGQTICLLYILKGNFRPDLQKETIDYEALINCLKYINIIYKGRNIGSPIIGASPFDGNGDKEKIIGIFQEFLTDVDITLYDYEQISQQEKRLAVIKNIMKEKAESKKSGDTSKYHKLSRERKEFEEKLKSINNLTYNN